MYSLFRILFFAFNQQEIASLSKADWWQAIIGGLRFDISALAFLNVFWITLSLIFPLNTQVKWQQFLLGFAFYVPNTLAILFEVSDWVYFNFNRKRATIEIFDLIFSKGDFLNLLPSYIQKFWFVPIIAILVLCLMVWFHRRLNRYFAKRWQLFLDLQFRLNAKDKFIFRPLTTILVIAIAVVAMRGGLQLMPINARNAVEYLKPEQSALVLNTPFSIITSVESGRLQTLTFMSDEEAEQLLHPIKQYNYGKGFEKKNVVVIVWESFSKRFSALGSDKSVTPFFDSLSQKSIVFTNAYANALRSNEGVPAIFSGIPAMMESPVITSIYTNNQFDALPLLLQKEGYQTAFFHGGKNGTMSLDTYAKNAGFEKYVGRTEYGVNKDYDGAWGVWDKPFFQFSIDGISALKQPFCAGLFSLSSHIPFNVPKDYKPSSVNAKSDVERSMNYTDQALSEFFKSAATKEWYQNSIFVIVADHGCPLADSSFYIDGLGRYQIPMLIFDPKNNGEMQTVSKLMQQIDISPTILDYLSYPNAFFSLGNSAFDTTAYRFNFNFLSGNYSLLSNQYHVKTNGYTITDIYKYPEDVKDKFNLINQTYNQQDITALEAHFKAFLQILHNGMINDGLSKHTYQSNKTIK